MGRFWAMASPCELLIETQDSMLANHLTSVAYAETKRIEQKFSRYLPNNPMANINDSQGKPIAIDNEFFRLLELANSCFQLSDGLFDITSGAINPAVPTCVICTALRLGRIFAIPKSASL